jgi:transcriptional regulator of acetoin/glycerol metabolism
MGRASTRLHGDGETDSVAEARVRFLAAEAVSPALVREPILASWSRSRDWHVAADRPEQRYLGEPDLDSALARAAEPVLRHLHEQLEGQPISVVLTDASGLVLLRLTGDRDLERQLDAITLAPGFVYAEDVVGTNGIGTALESGGPAHVFGHEHYAEHLERMACAAVPVRDPLSGKTACVLDLTCWRRHADPLMISLARSTADQLGQALAEIGGGQGMRLLREYTRACRHIGGIVLALGDDVVMLNDHARQALSPADQAELISRATEALAAGPRGAAGRSTVDLPSGAVARMFCHPVSAADGVVHVRLLTTAGAGEVAAGRGPTPLPGLVGSSTAWRRASRAVEAGYRRGEWLAVEGEAGAGKLALVRAVHQRCQPTAPCHVIDVAADQNWLAQARSELVDGTGTLVFRHVHALSDGELRALADVLAEARAQAGAGVTDEIHGIGGVEGPDGRPDGARADGERALQVAVTLDRGTARADLSGLLRLFPATVEVPPLRHHGEDVRELVPFFLGRLGQQARVSCSPAALQLLLRHPWPGNAAQLWQVLRQVAQRRRTGQIRPEDLPPECWTVSRRVLSPVESIERDAIVAALLDHAGSKIAAARALGMSRATIYRRIRDYGIVTP